MSLLGKVEAGIEGSEGEEKRLGGRGRRREEEEEERQQEGPR